MRQRDPRSWSCIASKAEISSQGVKMSREVNTKWFVHLRRTMKVIYKPINRLEDMLIHPISDVSESSIVKYYAMFDAMHILGEVTHHER